MPARSSSPACSRRPDTRTGHGRGVGEQISNVPRLQHHRCPRLGCRRTDFPLPTSGGIPFVCNHIEIILIAVVALDTPLANYLRLLARTRTGEPARASARTRVRACSSALERQRSDNTCIETPRASNAKFCVVPSPLSFLQRIFNTGWAHRPVIGLASSRTSIHVSGEP